MVSGLKSFLFFLHRTAVMIMMITVTTAMGARTAAMIHKLFGGFFTTATEDCKVSLCKLKMQTASKSTFNCLHIMISIEGLLVPIYAFIFLSKRISNTVQFTYSIHIFNSKAAISSQAMLDDVRYHSNIHLQSK